MKNIYFILITLFMGSNSYGQLIDINSFYKSNTKQDKTISKFSLKPIGQIPTIKITESSRSDAKFDSRIITAIGGGFTLQRNSSKKGKYYSTYSWSPLTILLESSKVDDNNVYNISYCSTIGLFNNLLQFGIGYDFGEVKDRSRIFGVLNLGVNLTN